MLYINTCKENIKKNCHYAKYLLISVNFMDEYTSN